MLYARVAITISASTVFPTTFIRRCGLVGPRFYFTDRRQRAERQDGTLMKKFLSSLTAFLHAASVKAEQQTGRYHNSYFNTDFSIEGALIDDGISNVYIATEAKRSNRAFISVDGRELDAFKTSLQQARDKYLKWVDIAVDNKVTEMKKDLGIRFPAVTVAWTTNKWRFSFGNRINMRFIILDDGRMVASWSATVTASSDSSVSETVFFVFAGEDDFNSLISELDYQTIHSRLLTSKNNEELFK